jgi:hypothetical protein
MVVPESAVSASPVANQKRKEAKKAKWKRELAKI